MGTHAGSQPWTVRDQMLLRTAQVVHSYVHDEFDQILPVPVDFAVGGSFPDNRIVAVAPFSLYSLESRGDGSYAHDGGFFFATGRGGLAITAGAAIGQAVGNARRRAAAARAAQPAWHHLDHGTLCVNQFGFYLRTPTSLLWWDWGSILECHMAEPGRVGMLGMTPAGQCTYLIESDLAELVFASWAVKRQPQHPQFLHRVWLLPEWVDRYRTVYGPEAFDFTVPFRSRLNGLPPGGHMTSESTTTTDHDQVRRWVEEHDGKPASVRGTETSGEADGSDSTFFKRVNR